MTAMDFSGVIDLDSSGFVGGIEEATEATEDLEDSAQGVSESFIDIDSSGVIAGAGMATAGAGAQGLLDSTQDVRTQLGFAAETMGVTQDELTEMASSMADGTFEFDEAAETMSDWIAQGVDTEEQLRELTETSDLMADATGTTADVISGELAPIMASFGDDATDVAELQDEFTIAVQETLLEGDELTRLLQRSSDEMSEMGLSTDESIGLITTFQEETGLAGKELRTELNQALNDADGDFDAFIENTELSEGALEDWEERVDESEGAAQRYADVTDTNTSLMDDLREGFRGATAQAGNMLAPVNAAAPAMMGLGGAASFLSAVNVGMLVPSFGAMVAAITPLLPVILPLIAVAGALALAWKKDIGGIQDLVADFAADVEWAVGQVIQFIERLTDIAQTALSGDFAGAFEDAKRLVSDILEDIVPIIRDSVISAINWLREDAPGLLISAARTAVTTYIDIWRTIITDILPVVIDGLMSAIGWLRDEVPGLLISAARTAISAYIGIWRTILTDLPPIIRDGVTSAIHWVRDNGPGLIEDAFHAIGSSIRTSLLAMWGAGGTVRTLVTDGIVAVASYLKNDAPGDLKAAITAAFDALVAAGQAALEALTPTDGVIVQIIGDIASFIKNDAPGILTGALDFVIEAVMAAFTGLYEGLIGKSLIPDMFWDIYDWIRQTGAMLVENAVGVVTDAIFDALPTVSEMKDAGAGLVDAIVDGIKSSPDAVKDAVSGVVGEARDMLPFSPAKEGPLSDIDQSGEALPETFAAGIETTADAPVDATETMAAHATPRVPTGGSAGTRDGGKQITVNIRKIVTEDADSFADDLHRALRAQNFDRSI